MSFNALTGPDLTSTKRRKGFLCLSAKISETEKSLPVYFIPHCYTQCFRTTIVMMVDPEKQHVTSDRNFKNCQLFNQTASFFGREGRNSPFATYFLNLGFRKFRKIRCSHIYYNLEQLRKVS